MSVTGPAANTNAIHRLSELELKKGIIGEGSWHNQYKDSCYIFIGGLDHRMTEGDIIIVFSQFGEPIDINLKRDKDTGKSLGYCFLGYKDQRSTILAVDNFNGSTLLGRRIRVDHVMDYSAPVVYEDEVDDEGNKIRKEYKPTGAEGQGLDNYYVTETERLLKETSSKKAKQDTAQQMDEDEKWALEFEQMIKNENSESFDNPKETKEDRESVKKEHKERDRRGDRDRSRDRYRNRHRSRSRDRHRSRSRDRDRHKKRYRDASRERYRRRYSRSSSKDKHRRDRHKRSHRSHS
uniref:RNA-binding protein, putative n=1 Tax=Theileria annulata TaxID=5874 RepID=A0A3B0MTN2_THEAN